MKINLKTHTSYTCYLGSLLRTPAHKPRILVKQSVALVKRENGFTKTLLSLFFQGFLPGMILVNQFLRLLLECPIFAPKFPVLRARVPERLLIIASLESKGCLSCT